MHKGRRGGPKKTAHNPKALDSVFSRNRNGENIGFHFIGNGYTRNKKNTWAIPENMLADGRTFFVVRVHHGVAEKLNTVVQDGVASFETDRFSTYALVYEDAPSSGSAETSPETSAPTGSSVPSAPSTPSTLPTGRQDMWPVVLAASLLVLRAALAAVAGRRNRKADPVKCFQAESAEYKRGGYRIRPVF